MADRDAERIKADYLERLRQMLRRAPADVREDAVQEVRSHIEDEWQALGAGDLAALEKVLAKLGPPEAYGPDLAMELILSRGRRGHPVRNYVLAAIFWASTSLTGAVAVLLAALTFGFALGMIGVGIARSGGSNMVLINAVGYRFLMFQGDRFTFPPSDWSPAEVVVSGIAPALVLLAGLYVLSHLWLRSRLASRGLDLDERRPPRGWERNAIGFAVLVAALSLSSCLVLVFASNMVGIGRPGHLDLPSDFWRNPLGALAFVSLLIFFCSPVLGLLWSTRRTGAKSPGTKAQVQPYK